MRLYDNIKLNEEVEELAKRGIHKEYERKLMEKGFSNEKIFLFFIFFHNILKFFV